MSAGPRVNATAFRGHLTTWSLMALALGLLSGIAARAAGVGDAVVAVGSPIGQLWLSALQAIVLPLIITQLLVAITDAPATTMRSLGARAVVFFFLSLAAAAVFTLVLAPQVIALFGPAEGSAVAGGVTAPVVPAPAVTERTGGLWDAIGGLLPTNVIAAAARGDLLQLVLCTVALGLAINQLPAERRTVLVQLFRSLSDATFILVRWVLLAMPVGVFLLSSNLAVTMGSGAVGLVVVYSLIVSSVMLLFTALMYPATAVLGGFSVGAFARALAPAQLIAATTRSSIASLPALVDASRRLGLSPSAAAFILPLSTSVYKLGRPVSSTVKLLFLAHVYGIALTPTAITTFVVTSLLLSFTTPGIPSGGTVLRAVPLYVAAGIPIEGVVILDAADAIADISRTVLNVTGNLSAAAVVSRSVPIAATAAPEAEPLTRVS